MNAYAPYEGGLRSRKHCFLNVFYVKRENLSTLKGKCNQNFALDNLTIIKNREWLLVILKGKLFSWQEKIVESFDHLTAIQRKVQWVLLLFLRVMLSKIKSEGEQNREIEIIQKYKN